MQNFNIQQEEEDHVNNVDNNLPQLKSIVKDYLKFGRNYLKILVRIVEISPNFLENKEWANKACRIINFYARKMSSKSYKTYKFPGIKELGLKPLEFIKQLVSLYYMISDSELLKKEIIGDDRSYSKEILLDIGSTAFKKKLVNQKVLEKFEKLIQQLDQLKEKKIIYDKIVANCPDEFNCGLLYVLMKNPVKLPSSGLIVDLSSIKHHIAING